MKNLNIVDLLNYVIKILIIVTWVYLYNMGFLTTTRIITFIIILILIIGYSRITGFIFDFFKNKKIKKYIKVNSEKFRKVVYVLLEVHKWINPFFAFLIYTDKCLYKVNRYISGTKYIRYNFIIYVILKYLVMFGLIKLIIYKYYLFWYQLDNLTIMDILFKRMYGLILSVLIFTDVLNNLISYLSHYGIWIYIFIYYITSSICVIWELLSFYYFNNKNNIFFHYKIVNIFKYINMLKIYQYFIASLLYIPSVINIYLKKYTKMNIIIFLRSDFTWLGQIILSILEIITPRVAVEQNFKETFISVERFSDTSFMASGRIAYYIPQENRIPFKYFYYIGSLMNIGYFEATFQIFWESYKNDWSYNGFFKSIYEVKGKPSIFLYMQLFDLANLLDIHNQPINRLMDWMYFEITSKEYSNLLNESDTLIVKQNLLYFKNVDTLRAKLMYFIMWDIEYFYNENNKDYNWDCWIIQYDSILEVLLFQMDDGFELTIYPNDKLLKFYDPEENMEYLNRLFNVLGVIDNVYTVNTGKIINEEKYYVSNKFNNYNVKYEELLKILYVYDFKFHRCYERQCACSYLSFYEVEIAYKIEDFIVNLRKEWTESLKVEKLEERNWRLLKELEELM